MKVVPSKARSNVFRLAWVTGALSAALFLYRAVSDVGNTPIHTWNAVGCYFEGGARHYVGGQNCTFEARRATLFALPWLAYGEKLGCSLADASHPYSFTDLSCRPVNVWRPDNSFDIGWDAFSVWFTRPAQIYFLSQRPDWPGLLHALRDPSFLTTIPSPEHDRYPWLLPVIFSSVMRVLDSPSPVPLQALQGALWFFCAFLFWRTWPGAHVGWLLAFACAPIGGKFFFKIYGDLWVLTGLLAALWALDKRKLALFALAACFTIWLKAEAWIQLGALLSAWVAVTRSSKKERNFAMSATATWLFLSGCYLAWARMLPEATMYTPLSQRLLEAASYTHRLPKITGYYLDVLFRPDNWGILWPITAYVLWQSRRRIGLLPLAPLVAMLIIVPLSCLRFPDGAYKEIVLTGTPRGLWQLLPLAWLLLRESQKPTQLS